MRTIAERSPFSVTSSASMATRSRWLVGSSRRRMSGSGASTRASAARRASPPDRRAGSSSPVEPELVDHQAGAIGIVARGKSRLDIGEGRGVPGEVRLLRQVADGHRRLAEALAAVERDEPGRDLEKRRFSRAVPADDAEPLPRPDAEVDTAQERRPAKGQSDVLEKEKRRRRQGVIQSLSWAADQFPRGGGATDYHARAAIGMARPIDGTLQAEGG